MANKEPYSWGRTHWFGEPWPRADERAPICEDDRYRVDVPVGGTCIFCDEPILEGDRGVQYAASVVLGEDGLPAIGPEPACAHVECQLRNVTGNHLHLAGMCRHVGDCEENSTLSYRDEAKMVWEMFERERSRDA